MALYHQNMYLKHPRNIYENIIIICLKNSMCSKDLVYFWQLICYRYLCWISEIQFLRHIHINKPTNWVFDFILNFKPFENTRKMQYILVALVCCACFFGPTNSDYFDWSAKPNVPNRMHLPITYLDVSEEIVSLYGDTSKWTLDRVNGECPNMLINMDVYHIANISCSSRCSRTWRCILGKSVNKPVNNIIIYLLWHLTMS